MAFAPAKAQRYIYVPHGPRNEKKLIGQGLFGKVYAGIDKDDPSAKIAIKEVPCRNIRVGDLQRAEQELQIFCNLRHDNIVAYLGYKMGNAVFNIYMDQMNGVSLADRRSPVTDHELPLYTYQFFNGLQYLHSQKVAHGNLRPSNILFHDGKLKLANFGTHRMLLDESTNPFQDKILMYMAPEMKKDRNQTMTVESDIWSAGCVMITLSTGKPPRPTGQQNKIVIPGSSMTIATKEFILRCLQNAPSKRPTATQLLKDPLLTHLRPQEETLGAVGGAKMSDYTEVPADISCGVTTRTLIESSLKCARDLQQSNSDTQLMQHFIPSAIQNLQLDQLVSLDRSQQNDHVKRRSLNGILQVLYSRIAEMPSVKVDELMNTFKTLSATLLSARDSSRVMSARFHATLLTIFLIHQKRVFGELTKHQMPDMPKLKELLYPHLDKYGYSGSDFNELKAFLEKFLERWANEKSMMAKLPKSKPIAILRAVQKIGEYLLQVSKGTLPPSSVSEEEIIGKMTTGASWLECHNFIHFLTSLICTEHLYRERSVSLFLKMVYRIRDSINFKSYIHAVSVIYAYVRLLIHYSENVEITNKNSKFRNRFLNYLFNDTKPLYIGGTNKLLVGGPGEMNFETLLEYIKQKSDFKGDMSQVLSPIFFHPNETVSKLACTFCFGSNNTDGSFINYQQEYIADILEPFGFQMINTRKAECKQCQNAREKFHEVCDGQFGKSRHVVMTMAFPDDRDNAALHVAGMRSSRKAFQEEIGVLLELSNGGNHPNIVRLLAYQIDVDPIFYVAENMGASLDLTEFLKIRAQRLPRLTLVDLMRHAIMPLLSVVKFCHDRGILLRNITCNSFLAVDKGSSFMILLNAFHMARKTTRDIPAGSKSKLYFCGAKQDRIPLMWSAPEAILQCWHSEFTEVYMVALTILEILNREHPYSELSEWNDQQKIIEILKYRIRPKKTILVPDQLFRPVMECLTTVPENRLSLDSLQQRLQSFVKKVERSTQVLETAEARRPSGVRTPVIEIVQSIPDALMNVTSIDDLRNKRLQVKSTIIQCTKSELEAPDDPKVHDKLRVKSTLLRDLDGAHQSLLMQLKHNNIVKIVQILRLKNCTEMITQLPADPKVSVLQYVLNNVNVPAPELQLYFTQVADGMKYLHSMHLIHCCLQAQHVYLNPDNRQVQIGHLGRSAVIQQGPYDENVESTTVMPFRNIQPHLLANATRYSPREVNENGCHSMQSDVASFAHLIWEVHEAKDRRAGTPHNEVAPYAYNKTSEVLMEQRKCQTLPQQNSLPGWMYKLIKKCTLEPAYRRPLFPEIHECLTFKSHYEHPLVLDAEKRKTDTLEYEDHIYEFYDLGTVKYQDKEARPAFTPSMTPTLESRFQYPNSPPVPDRVDLYKGSGRHRDELVARDSGLSLLSVSECAEGGQMYDDCRHQRDQGGGYCEIIDEYLAPVSDHPTGYAKLSGQAGQPKTTARVTSLPPTPVVPVQGVPRHKSTTGQKTKNTKDSRNSTQL